MVHVLCRFVSNLVFAVGSILWFGLESRDGITFFTSLKLKKYLDQKVLRVFRNMRVKIRYIPPIRGVKPIYCFLVGKWWNEKIIDKTVQIPYDHYFTVIQCVKALGLIYTRVGWSDSSYSHIKCLAVELNSYMIAVFIAERRFFIILYGVTNISPFLIWCIWHKWAFKIISYCI